MYLLTGGSGNLGMELQKHLNCYAPSHFAFDVCDITSEKIFDGKYKWVSNYDCIIHSAAYTNVANAETENNRVVESNVLGSKNIFMLGSFYNKRVVYISTDYVYEGKSGNYKETDSPRPFNFYGFTKLAGESFANPEKDLIIRTSFKPNKPWAYPKAFIDLYTSADYVDVVSKKIISVIKKNLNGVINIGTERKSIYELARQRNSGVGEISVKDVKSVTLPRDVSMNLEKYDNWEKTNNG